MGHGIWSKMRFLSRNQHLTYIGINPLLWLRKLWHIAILLLTTCTLSYLYCFDTHVCVFLYHISIETKITFQGKISLFSYYMVPFPIFDSEGFLSIRCWAIAYRLVDSTASIYAVYLFIAHAIWLPTCTRPIVSVPTRFNQYICIYINL